LYLEAGIFIPHGKRRCFPKKKKNRRSSLSQGLKSQNIEFFFSGARPLLATPSYATG